MENKQNETGKKSLLLALVVGMSINAILSGLTMQAVSLSIFPVISLILATQMLYQSYLKTSTVEELPLIGIACFFLGLFGHSAFIKATTPGSGTNFFSIIISLVLLIWLGKKLGYFKPKTENSNESVE